MHFTNDVESATNVLGASWFGFARIVGDGLSVVVPSLLVHKQDEAITLACGRKKGSRGRKQGHVWEFTKQVCGMIAGYKIIFWGNDPLSYVCHNLQKQTNEDQIISTQAPNDRARDASS